MPTSNSRAIAATILADLLAGKGSLTGYLNDHKDNEAYSLLQELCFGSCRWYESLVYIVDQLVTRPIKNKDTDLKALLIVGLYQLRELSIPDYAVINETVAAANALGKSWARPLINAVLRNYLRNRQRIDQELGGAELPVLSLIHI